MAEKLCNVDVEVGTMIPVKNTKRPNFSNAKRTYINICVVDIEGNPESLLFTLNDLKRARYRASKNPEDVLKTEKGFWANLFG